MKKRFSLFVLKLLICPTTKEYTPDRVLDEIDEWDKKIPSTEDIDAKKAWQRKITYS